MSHNPSNTAAPPTAWPPLRIIALIAGAAMLALYAWAFVHAVGVVRNPNGDPFELIGIFWGSLTLLPLGLICLWSGLRGGEPRLRRARTALIIVAALCALLLALETLRRLSIAMDI